MRGDAPKLVEIVFDLSPDMVRQLRRVLEHIFVDVDLVLYLLGELCDLLYLIVDLLGGFADEADQFGVVGELRPFGRLAGDATSMNSGRKAGRD